MAPYDPKEAEPRIQKYWEENSIYKFDPEKEGEIFSIDTPPPTVSGRMHIGHTFSYSQQDFIARFMRMKGYNVFYPFGTDDNGLATDRLVERTKKVKSARMDREEYIRLCLKTLDEELRPEFIADWKRIAVSCDFSIFYSTINDHCRRLSQKSFLDLYKQGLEYRKKGPTMWCPNCAMAIAQVEMEDKELPSKFHEIVFRLPDNAPLLIATTRPELLPSCVAVFAHPDDARYKRLFGKKLKVPLFDYEVDLLPDPKADPEKGTGVVMCCTFGDQTDIEWYLEHKLQMKISFTKDGFMNENAGPFAGLKIKDARIAIVQALKDKGLHAGERDIVHPVNVHERCGSEIEILDSKQWYLSYLDKKDMLLKAGEDLNWFPQHMISRYTNWIRGLKWDWCLSRQRHFGIPIPMWYCDSCDAEIPATEDMLPVDPANTAPPVAKCPKCGSTNFTPDRDVLDTWATSSMSPIIVRELFRGTPTYDRVYPMTLRPQAHDIITFWLFNTVVKSQLHHKVNPWRDVMISGWALDPHGKKMSKSKGNIVVPQEMIEKYCADALRFWAAGSKLGEDMPFQEKDLVTGRKFITKLWNASRFVFMNLEDFDPERDAMAFDDLETIDRWILSEFNSIIKESDERFMRYEYSHGKNAIERFFWKSFCDNYLEIVKERVYNPQSRGERARRSAQFTLYTILDGVLKMMAPIMPHITEEIYLLDLRKHQGEKSIHLARMPEYDEAMVDKDAEAAGALALYVLEKARAAKTGQNLSLKTGLSVINVKGKISEDAFQSIAKDLLSATNAKEIFYSFADEEAEVVEIGL